MKIVKFTVSDLPISCWANGGGRTQVAVCYPESSSMSDFLWRVSFATVTSRTSPFSVLPGVVRQLGLLKCSGDARGLCVRKIGEASDESFVLVEPGSIRSFDGSTPLVAEMILEESAEKDSDNERQVTDFNLMVRSEKGVGAVPIAASTCGVSLAPFGHLPPSVRFPARVLGGVYVAFAPSRVRLLCDGGGTADVALCEGYWWSWGGDGTVVESCSEVAAGAPLVPDGGGLGVAYAIVQSCQ